MKAALTARAHAVEREPSDPASDAVDAVDAVDALQTLDPLASSGNFLALREGLDAANVLSSIDKDERMDRLRKYWGDAREDFETVLSRRSRFYGTSEQLRTATMLSTVTT